MPHMYFLMCRDFITTVSRGRMHGMMMHLISFVLCAEVPTLLRRLSTRWWQLNPMTSRQTRGSSWSVLHSCCEHVRDQCWLEKRRRTVGWRRRWRTFSEIPGCLWWQNRGIKPLLVDLHGYSYIVKKRSANTRFRLPLVIMRRSRLSTAGDRTFGIAAPHLWNSLPACITSANTLPTFKKHLKTHLFNLSYNP